MVTLSKHFVLPTKEKKINFVVCLVLKKSFWSHLFKCVHTVEHNNNIAAYLYYSRVIYLTFPSQLNQLFSKNYSLRLCNSKQDILVAHFLKSRLYTKMVWISWDTQRILWWKSCNVPALLTIRTFLFVVTTADQRHHPHTRQLLPSAAGW